MPGCNYFHAWECKSYTHLLGIVYVIACKLPFIFVYSLFPSPHPTAKLEFPYMPFLLALNICCKAEELPVSSLGGCRDEHMDGEEDR